MRQFARRLWCWTVRYSPFSFLGWFLVTVFLGVLWPLSANILMAVLLLGWVCIAITVYATRTRAKEEVKKRLRRLGNSGRLDALGTLLEALDHEEEIAATAREALERLWPHVLRAPHAVFLTESQQRSLCQLVSDRPDVTG